MLRPDYLVANYCSSRVLGHLDASAGASKVNTRTTDASPLLLVNAASAHMLQAAAQL
jgi:hypothetical protein